MDLIKIYFSVGLCVRIRGPVKGQQNRSDCKDRKSRTFFSDATSDTMCLTTQLNANVARR